MEQSVPGHADDDILGKNMHTINKNTS